MTQEEAQRLHKWLAQQGVASRRKAEEMIQSGRVSVNGEVATIGMSVLPGQDVVTVDGKKLKSAAPARLYWLFYKPVRTLTSRIGTDSQATIYDMPSLAKSALRLGMNPVGRLDYMSEGLLLLTNDGEMCHRLTHPKHHVPKRYQVLVDGRLTTQDLRRIQQHGVELEDGVARAEIAYANVGDGGNTHWYYVTVTEGRNRLVRRIFAHFGLNVRRLIRVRLGDLELPARLAPGEYVQLTSEQIRYLKKITRVWVEHPQERD